MSFAGGKRWSRIFRSTKNPIVKTNDRFRNVKQYFSVDVSGLNSDHRIPAAGAGGFGRGSGSKPKRWGVSS